MQILLYFVIVLHVIVCLFLIGVVLLQQGRSADLAGAFGIAGIPVIDVSARFLAPTSFGDPVELTSQVKEFRASSFELEHALIVRGALAVEGRETRLWETRDTASPSQIKAQPVPAEIIARFQAR